VGNFHSIVRVLGRQRKGQIEWDGYVVLMKQTRNTTFWWKNLLESQYEDGRLILKFILRK